MNYFSNKSCNDTSLLIERNCPIHEDIDVSFVIPCYNEEGNIFQFYDAFCKAFIKSDYKCELIFIDDGSLDRTFYEIEQLIAKADNPKIHIVGIQLSKNFGKESGIWQSPNDAIEMLNQLITHPDIDCIAAFQKNRNEKGLIKSLKKGFYKIFAKITGMNSIQDASDFRVFNRKVAQALLEMPERNRFSKGMFSWVGFETIPYAYTQKERLVGESKW